MSQMKAMREAIAELKLPQTNGQSLTYGHDIVVGEDECLSVSIGDDIWDLLSSDDEISANTDNGVEHEESASLVSVELRNADWLDMICAQTASRKSGLDPGDLEEHISALLASDMKGKLVPGFTEPIQRYLDDELQMVLADTLGYDELDLVTEILGHRNEISESRTHDHQNNGVLDQLRTREQRLEALRRQDLQHKTAPLAETVQRENAKYPHVYKAHDVGNTLSSYGHKYAFPLGSKRDDHEVELLVYSILS